MKRLAKGILTGMLAMGLSTSPVSGSSVNWELTEVAESMEELSEVEKVVLCESEGAERAIVHVLQHHYLNPGIFHYINTHGSPSEREEAMELMRWLYGEINGIQRAGYGILGQLASEGYDRVYAEGVGEWESEQPLDVFAGVALQRLADLRSAGYFADDTAASEYIAWRALEHNQNNTVGHPTAQEERFIVITPNDTPQSLEDFRYLSGAELLLGASGMIVLAPLENERVYELALEERGGDRIALDGREDMLIDRISRAKEPLAVAYLGGMHVLGGKASCGDSFEMGERASFRDNMDMWNRYSGTFGNPKISLLEVHPVGIGKVLEEQSDFASKAKELYRRVSQRTTSP